MPTDYSKKKNAELAELLKARSLPHTGKKDELIARLQESDAKAAAPTKEEPAKTTAPGAEDEIDWEDDTPVTTTAPTTANPPATVAPAPAPDTRKPAAKAAPTTIAPATDTKPSDPTTEPAATTTEDPSNRTTEETKPPPPDFSSHLPTTTLDAELAKRVARAQRFGLPAPDASEKTTTDAQKLLERAKKFGTDQTKAVVKGLDEALPERTKKRGRGEGDEAETGRREGSKARRQGGGGGGGGRGGRGDRSRRGGGNRGSPEVKGKGGGLSEKDRIAAEARKKRFAAAA